jgi:signal transduction histidine kinase
MRKPTFRPSRQTYLVLTLAGVLVPTLFLTLFGLNLVRRLFGFQDEILTEYSRFSVEFAASEFNRYITSAQREIAQHLQLLALVDRFVPEDELRRIETTYPLVQDAWLVAPDGAVIFASPAPPPITIGIGPVAPAPHPAPDRARAKRLVERVLDAATQRHVLISGEIHYYTGSDDQGPYQLAAFPLVDAQNHSRGVGGFFLNVDVLRRGDLARLLDRTIHTAEGRFSPDFGEVLTLVVRDHRNEVVYTHSHGAKQATCRNTRDLATADLRDVLPGWRMGITYTKASGFAWTRRIVTVQLGLMLLAATLIIIFTVFSVRFSLRQMELSKLKSHFVSNITHELKTPLAAIRLYTETLQQGRVRDRGEADRFLGIIHKESVRLTQLINNILDFARIEDGRRRYRFEPASVGAVVRDVVDAYAYQLRNKGFELDLAIEEDLPQGLVDRDALGQAVLNLLDNAVKYSRDDRQIAVSVAAERPAGGPATANGHGAILIEVRDRGIGIPPAEQTRIFEAFYRVEKGLEHDVKGSGLGLAVVHHIVQAHGGTVRVESRPRGGSTFTIRLPYREASQSEPTERSA